MKKCGMLITTLFLATGIAGLATAAEVQYDFAATVSNNISISGHVLVETNDPGFAPGGTVQFNTGGITEFYFLADNGVITEVIDSSLINPTPQTMKLTFSTTNFPEVEAWDFSFSNEWYGGVIIQMITVHSPTNSGYEQWAGNQLGGSSFPSSGIWVAPTDVVSTEDVNWGSVKTFFR